MIERLSTSQHLGIQLMTKRLDRSTASAAEKVAEIQTFITRWARALPAEIAQLPSI